MKSPLPVFLLTGFLGSGKTTLLARLLRDPAFADTAVVVNELGEVGLDHVLVNRGSEEGVVLLDSGCLCCALGNSLQETLEDLHYRRVRGAVPPFARVVVETTGVADPGPIAATLLLDPAIARHYRLGGIVTTVDAVNGAQALGRFVEAIRQVACADRIIVTKGDIADPLRIAALGAQLATINPHASRMAAISGAIPADAVLVDLLAPFALASLVGQTGRDRMEGMDQCPAGRDPAREHDHGHADHIGAQGIATTTIRLTEPLTWARYAQWLDAMQKRVGDALLRVKGVVRMDDGGAYALHAAMRLFSAPLPLANMPDGFGDGVVIVITQNARAQLLDEMRRMLV
jgi:G3E family GTPase